MVGTGPATVAVCCDRPVVLTVTCSDQARGSFFDVARSTGSRRQVLDPGQVFECRIAAGLADITFGPATEFRFDPDGGGDDGG